jgi:hypothetical protein
LKYVYIPEITHVIRSDTLHSLCAALGEHLFVGDVFLVHNYLPWNNAMLPVCVFLSFLHRPARKCFVKTNAQVQTGVPSFSLGPGVSERTDMCQEHIDNITLWWQRRPATCCYLYRQRQLCPLLWPSVAQVNLYTRLWTTLRLFFLKCQVVPQLTVGEVPLVTWEMRTEILVRNPEAKRPLGRPRHRSQDNVEIYLNGIS